MKFNLLIIAIMAFIFSACRQYNHQDGSHDEHEEHPAISQNTAGAEDHEAAEHMASEKTGAVVFTLEQAGKIDFATGFPVSEPFGQIIKTTALVQSPQGSEMVVSAKSAGIVLFSGNTLLEGADVKSGQGLFRISSDGLLDNNIAVRLSEAGSNYQKAKADYKRMKGLAIERIVSEKDLLAAKNQYETQKAAYDHLTSNAVASGQNIVSPMSGFVRQIFVRNGAYVEAGQAVMVVSQNKTLLLTAEVRQRYAPVLGAIASANIFSQVDNKTYTLEQLNGKVLSYGKSANADNFLIPVNLQIDNLGHFVPGSFVEIYLKTITSGNALTIPLTAIMEEQGTFFVWVQIRPEMYEKREVKMGASDGLKVEITGGISQSDRIVVKGAVFIKLAQATGALDAHSGHVH
jgi:membrane fusion protein, heavy metal efflux system